MRFFNKGNNMINQTPTPKTEHSAEVYTPRKIGRPKRLPRNDGVSFHSQPYKSVYVGEKRIQSCGGMAECLKAYKHRGNIRLTVKWLQDDLIQEVWAKSFVYRSLKHPNTRTAFGVGFHGVDAPPTVMANQVAYKSWLHRCAFHKEGTALLCDDWQEWSTYYKWYKQHVEPKRISAPRAQWCVDTDLSTVWTGDQKVYSPSTVHVVPFNVNISLARFMESVKQLKPLLDESAKEVVLPTAINYLKTKDRLRFKVYGMALYFPCTLQGRKEAAVALLDYRHSELMRHAEQWSKYILPSTMVMLRTLRDVYSRNLGIVTSH